MVECINCKYYRELQYKNSFAKSICEITHIINPQYCTYINNDEEVEDMNICYNCKYWHGGGDWGLSCEKDYYNCSSNGFDEVCEQFERNDNYKGDFLK